MLQQPGRDRQPWLPRNERLGESEPPERLRHDLVTVDRRCPVLFAGPFFTSVGVMSRLVGRGCALAIWVESEFIAT
jgi:hypothetical protein